MERFVAPMLPVPKQRWDGLVYLHGLLPENQGDNSLDNLVVSSGDFGLAYLTERWAARFVGELLRNFVVCFVGYSIEDPVLRYRLRVAPFRGRFGRRGGGLGRSFLRPLQELERFASRKGALPSQTYHEEGLTGGTAESHIMDNRTRGRRLDHNSDAKACVAACRCCGGGGQVLHWFSRGHERCLAGHRDVHTGCNAPGRRCAD